MRKELKTEKDGTDGRQAFLDLLLEMEENGELDEQDIQQEVGRMHRSESIFKIIQNFEYSWNTLIECLFWFLPHYQSLTIYKHWILIIYLYMIFKFSG